MEFHQTSSALNPARRVLIIDDDPAVCRMIQRLVEKQGLEADTTLTLNEGLRAAQVSTYDVVFLDVRMPDGNGLDFIPKLRATASSPEVIIMTGFGTGHGAETAIKSGAWDYIQKTGSTAEILLPLSRALQYREDKRLEFARGPRAALNRNGIVGSSAALQTSLDQLAQAASSDANVVITGETGTGKELFARTIHRNSKRYEREFVAVDCAALPETLAESVLFGHSKGAFTGADRSREGLFRRAHHGTLFLDEVGELSLSLQKTLLRALQERRFRPVGDSGEIESDFRLIAATNRDLDRSVENGRFRKDLLYRLRTIRVELSPLRERRSDIQELTMHFIARFSQRKGIPIKGISPEFLEALMNYPWPGNVREFVNCLEGALSKAKDSPTLYRIHLPIEVRISEARTSLGDQQPPNGVSKKGTSLSAGPGTLQNVLEETEKTYLEEILSLTCGDIREACNISGLSRSSLYAKMRKHGLHRNG